LHYLTGLKNLLNRAPGAPGPTRARVSPPEPGPGPDRAPLWQGPDGTCCQKNVLKKVKMISIHWDAVSSHTKIFLAVFTRPDRGP